MILRAAALEDRSALNALTQASRAYDGRYRAMLDGYEINDAQMARDVFRVAEIEGAITGYYALALAPPELDLLFVADGAHGLGVGRALFADMRREACRRGIGRVRIVSHPPSVGFYRAMGAVEVGEVAPTGAIDWARPILEIATGPQ